MHPGILWQWDPLMDYSGRSSFTSFVQLWQSLEDGCDPSNIIKYNVESCVFMRSVPMRKELNIYAACVFITVTGQLVHPAAARQQRSLTRKDFWTILGHIGHWGGALYFVHCINFEKFMRRKLNFKTKYRRTVEINKHKVLTSLIPFGTIFIVPMLSRNREAIQNMLFSFIVLAMAILSKTKAVCLLLYHH